MCQESSAGMHEYIPNRPITDHVLSYTMVSSSIRCWRYHYALSTSDLPIDWAVCDHMRCPDYYTEAVLSQCPMRAYPCTTEEEFNYGRCLKCDGEGCPSIGYDAERTKGKSSGKHFLETSKTPPFCGIFCFVSLFVPSFHIRKTKGIACTFELTQFSLIYWKL